MGPPALHARTFPYNIPLLLRYVPFSTSFYYPFSIPSLSLLYPFSIPSLFLIIIFIVIFRLCEKVSAIYSILD